LEPSASPLQSKTRKKKQHHIIKNKEKKAMRVWNVRRFSERHLASQILCLIAGSTLRCGALCN